MAATNDSMTAFSPYPITFTPVLKDYIWGGRNLARVLGRQLPDGIIAESWEIAAHSDGTTIVDNGALAGKPLTSVHMQLGSELVGRRAAWAQARGKFPLLVKLLDATRRLSVQVHPDDDYARIHEDNELGKTEMWVVLYAEEDAEVVLGVTAGTTRDDFRRALEDGNLNPFLHRVQIKQGDVVCVPSGTLHAILGGSVIAEIQQNSNTTYRVFDWNRIQNGKHRPLHIDKAMDVIDFGIIEPGLCLPRLVSSYQGIHRYRLCQNQYFVADRLDMDFGAIHEDVCNGDSLAIWGVISGGVELNGVKLSAVRFSLLPASMGAYRVTATAESVLLRVILGT